MSYFNQINQELNTIILHRKIKARTENQYAVNSQYEISPKMTTVAIPAYNIGTNFNPWLIKPWFIGGSI